MSTPSPYSKNNTASLDVGTGYGYLEGISGSSSSSNLAGKLVKVVGAVEGTGQTIFETLGPGNRSRRMVVVEDVYFGKTPFDREPRGDFISVRQFRRGDTVLLRCASGETVSKGDYLVSDGSGNVISLAGIPPHSDLSLIGYANEDFVQAGIAYTPSRFSATIL